MQKWTCILALGLARPAEQPLQESCSLPQLPQLESSRDRDLVLVCSEANSDHNGDKEKDSEQGGKSRSHIKRRLGPALLYNIQLR